MLVIKIELWPYGNQQDATEIGRLLIMNQGDSQTPEIGNYEAHLLKQGGIVIQTAEVRNHPRLTSTPWNLMRKALEALGV